MKILIEMPQEEYQKLLDGRIAVTTMRKAIRNGTVLSEAQADGDLISKNNAITSVCQWGTTLERTGTYTITVAEMKQTITDMLCDMPSVAIPTEHDVSRQAVLGNLCDSCTNIGCEFQSGIIRTECAFYMPPHIESDNCGNYVVISSIKPQEPKTGHWIGEKAYPICGECGCNIYEEYVKCQDYAEISKPMKFCPSCGAKMD